jgi:hypothetical protein
MKPLRRPYRGRPQRTGFDGEHGAACTMGLEGIVSKRATSRYRSGSWRSWVVKNPDDQDGKPDVWPGAPC